MHGARTAGRPRRIALRASWLFDATYDDLRPEPMILIDGHTIVALDHGVDPPTDAEVHDLAGATLLSGLVESHVHLAFDASTGPVVAALAARDDDEALPLPERGGRRRRRGAARGRPRTGRTRGRRRQDHGPAAAR